MAKRAPAGPWGGAVLRTTLARIEAGWPPGLTVLTGDDLFHLDRAQRALVARLTSGEGGAQALTVFGERKADVGSVVSAVCSSGMFSSRRVVLVRDVDALEGKPGALSAYAAAPPEGSFLVVRAPKLDGRRLLHRELLESSGLIEFRSAAENEKTLLRREAAELAKERGLALEQEAAEFLVEACAGDLLRLSGELDKIREWLGRDSRGAVSLRDAREVATGAGALSGWELADAVLARDRAEALAACRRLAEAGEPPLRTLGGLAWRARAMLQVKAAIEAGTRPEEALRAVWAGVPPGRLLAGLARWPLDDLLAVPGRLLGADRIFKSRGIDPRAVLEALADRLAGRAPGPDGARR